jgi:tryptophan halogenase
MSGTLSKVMVVGRDADLWMTVDAIAHALAPSGVRVLAVELPSRLKASHISATLPPLEALHAKLNLNESELIRVAGASFSFGQNIVAGCRRVPNFFHAWGAYGAPIDGSAFYPCWLKAVRLGFNGGFQSFSPTAVAATNGRMLLPDDATTAFGRTDYGYHLQTLAYVGILKSRSAALGVQMVEAQDISVERSAAGPIAALMVDGIARLEAQFFIDATGEDALLMAGTLQSPQESWRSYFHADRRLVGMAPKFASLPPFAEIRTSGGGWTVLHPSQAATGIVHAFSSATTTDEGALQAATAAAGAPLADVSFHSLTPSARNQPWSDNCIAVGRAACSLDAIHDVELHALQLAIVHLLSLFPVNAEFAAERNEYNRIMRSYYERIRDFQCAFYALAPFEGEFWNHARAGAAPQSLMHKINTFRARGDVAPMEDETFLPESWQAIFTGFGVWPETLPPSMDRILPNRIQEEFRRIHTFIRAKVLEQPTHDAYLDTLGRGSP